MLGLLDCPELDAYCFDRELPKGFFGTSTVIRHKVTGIKFVCKIISRSAFSSREKLDGFISRNEKIKSLKIPSVVPFCKEIERGERVIIIRPYVDYPNLSEYVDAMACFDSAKVLSIWQAIVRSYSALAESEIHSLPIKPSNIFVLNERTVTITDPYELNSQSNWAEETPDIIQLLFLAPEYFSPPECPGIASDIWSLGAILAFMAGARLPWTSRNLVSMVKELTKSRIEAPQGLPPEIDPIVKLILKRDPLDRPTVHQLNELQIKPAPKQRRLTAPIAPKSVIPALSRDASADQAVERVKPASNDIEDKAPNVVPVAASLRCLRPPFLPFRPACGSATQLQGMSKVPLNKVITPIINQPNTSTCTVRYRFFAPKASAPHSYTPPTAI